MTVKELLAKLQSHVDNGHGDLLVLGYCSASEDAELIEAANLFTPGDFEYCKGDNPMKFETPQSYVSISGDVLGEDYEPEPNEHWLAENTPEMLASRGGKVKPW